MARGQAGVVLALVHLGQRGNWRRCTGSSGAAGSPGATAARQGCPAFVDVDSQQKRVFGHYKQGTAFGFTKIGGESVLVRGLNVLAATIGTPLAAPVIAAVRQRRLRRGTASLLTEAIGTARNAGCSAHDRGAGGLGVLQLGGRAGRRSGGGVVFGHRAAESGRQGRDRRDPSYGLDADLLSPSAVG
jgi:hypothetical protein